MFETLVVIAILLAVVIAVVLILATAKPHTFRVERAAVIQAPPERIFSLIDDFHKWRAWSPWEDRDPALKRIYEGAAHGKGAVYAWEGNRNVGAGRMEILSATSPSAIVIKLDFIKPFEGHNIAEFTMLPRGGATDAATTISTNITWAMHGPAPLMHRVMQVFMDLDRMIGKDFEAGLAKLRRAAER
jgi:uncharacterized protein YndB with AHSA1/START domain